MTRLTRAFTLFEVILVITLILILVGLAFWVFRHQLAKGRDAKRKDDLEKIRLAFEDYYNDHGCYPDPAILENCGSDLLSPYLKRDNLFIQRPTCPGINKIIIINCIRL